MKYRFQLFLVDVFEGYGCFGSDVKILKIARKAKKVGSKENKSSKISSETMLVTIFGEKGYVKLCWKIVLYKEVVRRLIEFIAFGLS